MRKLMREPLLQFLLIGLLIFAYYQWWAPVADEDRLVVSEEQVNRLYGRWQNTWKRSPNEVEQKGIVQQYIRDELLFREAKKIGLDQEDAVVRNRLIQKMKFLLDSQVEPPSDADIKSWLISYQDKYQIDAKYSFQQVYLGRDIEQAEADELITQLASGLHADQFSKSILLPKRVDGMSYSAVEKTFGEGFAGGLAMLPKQSWAGLVESGYGSHLVYLEQYQPQRPATIDDIGIRQRLVNDYLSAKKQDQEQRLLDELKNRYQVEVHIP